MNSALDILFLRRPRLRYVSPGVCEASFSGSGAPIIILDAFGRLLGPTGLILTGAGGFFLSWNNYPGALCFSVYKAVDELDPFGAYVLIAECITDNFITLEDFGPGTYRVTAITEEGESEPSDPITIPEGAGSVVVVVTANPDSTSPYSEVPGKFIISKFGFHNTDLVVNFVISGTAVSGEDYTPIAATATILSGNEFVEVLVTALLEANDPEGPETVVLTLAAGGFYIVGDEDQATVTISACPAEVGDPTPEDTESGIGDQFLRSMVFNTVGTSFGDIFPIDLSIYPPGSTYEVRYIRGAYKPLPSDPNEFCGEGVSDTNWYIGRFSLKIFADDFSSGAEVHDFDPDPEGYAQGSQAEVEALWSGLTFTQTANESIGISTLINSCPFGMEQGQPNPTFHLWGIGIPVTALVLPVDLRLVDYTPTIFDPLQCNDVIENADPEWDGTLVSTIQLTNFHLWQSAAARTINDLSLTDIRLNYITNHPTSENSRGWSLEISYRNTDFESTVEGWFGLKGVGDSPVGIYYRASGCHLEPECITVEEYTP